SLSAMKWGRGLGRGGAFLLKPFAMFFSEHKNGHTSKARCLVKKGFYRAHPISKKGAQLSAPGN
ncbi:MAG TPA: hypothetical protein VG347_20275, partial [Verrucomicrobiae bacterium]|nr:hypothetical protein [Verrucomicrobiae bacterium]